MIWEPDEPPAKPSYASKIGYGAVGMIVLVKNAFDDHASVKVDFDHGLPGEHTAVYWCRASDLRVIKEKDFHIFRAIQALDVGA